MNFFSRELLLNAGGKFAPVIFDVGGSTTEWVIPFGIKKVRIECVASKGRDGNSSVTNSPAGGNGGKVSCTLDVSHIKKLFITVADSRNSNATAYNSSYISAIKNDMNSRLIVAGGGGDSCYGGTGGAGGGLAAGNAINNFGGGEWAAYQGYGGTQTAGGAGSYYRDMRAGALRGGHAGTFGYGGGGGFTRGDLSKTNEGGTGGDGWYGGGGGWGNNTDLYFAGAGGGGSSYTHPTLCSEVVHTQGFNPGATGWVKISMVK